MSDAAVLAKGARFEVQYTISPPESKCPSSSYC